MRRGPFSNSWGLDWDHEGLPMRLPSHEAKQAVKKQILIWITRDDGVAKCAPLLVTILANSLLLFSHRIRYGAWGEID